MLRLTETALLSLFEQFTDKINSYTVKSNNRNGRTNNVLPFLFFVFA